MKEALQIILMIVILVCVYGLTRWVNAWRIRRAYAFIIQDLNGKQAFDPDTAVDLPYARMRILRVGLRDFRPRAMGFLISGDIVGKTADDRYYLKNRELASTVMAQDPTISIKGEEG
jgi:hypothetical protein